MRKRQVSKKVVLVKLLLIVVLGALLGLSCLFSTPIEKFLHIGTKAASITAKEQITGDLKVHFLDVGQADCTFIELPDGKNIMIDAALASSADHIIDYVKALGAKQIDYFILTHSDNDHVGGAKKIFDAFEIKNVFRPFQIAVDGDGNAVNGERLKSYYEMYSKNTVSKAKNVSYVNFITAAYTEKYKENGVEKQASVYVTYDGLKLPLAGEAEYNFEFFAPLIKDDSEFDYEKTSTYGYPTKYYENANNASPVMLLEYNDKSFVFTGDAEAEVESDFINSLDEFERARFANVDVMQAGHHGSKTSNTDKLIDVLKPNYFVVSAGKGNKFNHPNEEVVKRINNYSHTVSDYLLITFESKDIMFGFNNDGELLYAAFAGGNGVAVRWYHIALSVFVIGATVIISVRVSKNNGTTAKNVIKETKKAIKKANNNKM